jgi:hypothetical protein
MRAQTRHDSVKPHNERQHRDHISPQEQRKTKRTDEWQKEKRSKSHQGCRKDGKGSPSRNLEHTYSLSVLRRIGEHFFRMPISEVMERIEQSTKPEQFWGHTLGIDWLSRERDTLFR